MFSFDSSLPTYNLVLDTVFLKKGEIVWENDIQAVHDSHDC